MVVPEEAVAVAVVCVEEEAVAVAVAEEGVKLVNLGTTGWTTHLAAGWGAAKRCAQGVPTCAFHRQRMGDSMATGRSSSTRRAQIHRRRTRRYERSHNICASALFAF